MNNTELVTLRQRKGGRKREREEGKKEGQKERRKDGRKGKEPLSRLRWLYWKL